MYDPCVIIFNSSCIPLRHIVTLQSTYDEAEFKQWYYTQYHELDDDQFVYCESREERDALLAHLKQARAYRLEAPIWAEKETDDGIEDLPGRLLRRAGQTIQSMFAQYVGKHPFAASSTGNSHVFHVHLSIRVSAGNDPQLSVVIWLDKDDISEREWNRLLDAMSDIMIAGWGKQFTEDYPCDNGDFRYWVHFGNLGDEKVEFSVQEI